MGHCISGPNMYGITLSPENHNEGGSLDRCVMYHPFKTASSEDLKITVTTHMPDPGDPEWVVKTTHDYQCFRAERT